MTSALSYVTAMYVAHKYKYVNVRESLLVVSKIVEVLDLMGKHLPCQFIRQKNW